MFQGSSGQVIGLPDWVPADARAYLDHVGNGRSIRALARAGGVHPSTILRQVRRVEERREDPLVDAAIESLVRRDAGSSTGEWRMNSGALRRQAPADGQNADTDPEAGEREAWRVLVRLAEPGAVLALAAEMEKAVVVKDTPDGGSERSMITGRLTAEAMALRDWIEPVGEPGRIRRYRISAAGRAALKRRLAEAENARAGFAEAQTPFGDQHRSYATRTVPDGRRRVHVRYNVAESPVVALGRRRDKDGVPFLDDDLIAAAERLREDFELAQLGPRVAQNWERLLTGPEESRGFAESGPARGPAAARDRVAAALADLGPGLGDVALRCCCFLEGLEATERRLGWSSRSGKIVLRIALQRLRRHYEASGGLRSVLIG